MRRNPTLKTISQKGWPNMDFTSAFHIIDFHPLAIWKITYKLINEVIKFNFKIELKMSLSIKFGQSNYKESNILTGLTGLSGLNLGLQRKEPMALEQKFTFNICNFNICKYVGNKSVINPCFWFFNFKIMLGLLKWSLPIFSVFSLGKANITPRIWDPSRHSREEMINTLIL